MPFRILTKAETEALMRLAKDLHSGTAQLPPEILALHAEIEEAVGQAVKFMAIFGVVDYSMVARVYGLMVEKDVRYLDLVDSYRASGQKYLH
jgi:hypothetical protein